MGAVVIGIDPGFAALGVAVVRLLPDGEEVLALELIRTEKEKAKRKVLAADDNVRRAREAARELMTLWEQHDVVAIAAESMSFTRHASVSQKMGMTWGVIASLAEVYELPIVQASPQRVKDAVCGSKTASKEDVEAALKARYPEAAPLFAGPNGQREHVWDALAAVVAALESDVVRMARHLSVASLRFVPEVLPFGGQKSAFVVLSELLGEFNGPLMRVDGVGADQVYVGELDEERDDEAKRLARSLRRAFAGIVLEMMSPKKHEAVGKPSKPIRKSDKPTASATVVLRREVVVDCRDWLEKHLRGDADANRMLSVQTLVRGHWKRQPHGPNATERKYIHVEPYWRGPEDAPIAVRSHILNGSNES